MQTYLITGGAGFIGSHLCAALLKQGNRVINIDNFDPFYDPLIKHNNIRHLADNQNHILRKIDLRDREKLNEVFQSEPIDMVVHLAGMAGVRPSIENPILYEEVNIKGTMNILECMKTFGIKKLIFASSSSVYGNRPEPADFTEDMALNKMISPYAITKKAGEDFCYLYHKLYDLTVLALRFFTVYGPGQRPDLAIHKFVQLIDNHLPIPLYGDGSSMRDYSYIGDIINGITQAANYLHQHKEVFEVINLSGNRSISLKNLLHIIEETLQQKAIVNQLPMQPGDVEATRASIAKAQRLLHYEPQTTIEEGIRQFVAWYKNNKNNHA
ncbi:GDP-mannose 4,6-dehydratase [Pedobacter endophyticus]|uniref:GDP-mannose 4,6-dehydratase n=1 Tax=Pedobacter endophyticus TaxID=2789740 RepID=A0A7S9L1K2_9SPHI|nr:GDP-mannose 4,6-dehydratase [Pedobacter endophyticus]QPH40801.1 GDP-mannose 4,6-dehydratase [Pedobacter endophyticus]